MSKPLDPNARINLKVVSVLVLDRSQHSGDVVAQILSGFGVSKIHRCTEAAHARSLLATQSIDLLLIDPDLGDEDGFEFVRDVRRTSQEPNRFAPIILLTGHAKRSNVTRARDIGANFIVAKPLTPTILLQRIIWAVADRRAFIDSPNYVGPDRRFKNEGPPPGTDGRRADDLSAQLDSAAGQNMSQNEVDSLMKPHRVSL
jgi:DNA-binding response OmpR family regulator